MGVLSPKKPPGGPGAEVGKPGSVGDTLEGVGRAGRDAPAKGIFPTFKGALGVVDPNGNAERGGVLGLAGLALGAAMGSSIDSVFT